MTLIMMTIVGVGAVRAFDRSKRRVILGQAVRVWRRVSGRDASRFADRLDASIGVGVSAIRERPSILRLPLLLSIGDWAASVAALWLSFDAFGEPLGLGVLVTGFVIGIVAGHLSLVPGGLGVQEGTMTGAYVIL